MKLPQARLRDLISETHRTFALNINFIYMLKKYIITFVLAFVFLFSPAPPTAFSGSEEIKVPDTLNPELDYLLGLASPDSKDAFDPGLIEKVLDFVAAPKSDAALYCADKKLGANSAYYEFDIQSDLDHILRYAYNPGIPAFALRPSSVRLSYWIEVNGQKQSLPQLWKSLPNADTPVIVRGVEHIEIAPDINTGAYYKYDTDETMILCKYRGRNLLISISKQKDKSDVGRKGLILGKDENWHYFYSGQVGLTKTGLGWVNSYMYDSFSVTFYYEVDPQKSVVKCGSFKWLRAGWANLNMVRNDHIRRGLKRFAKDFKSILEHPSLPKSSELTGIFSNHKNLSLDDLRSKTKSHLKKMERLLEDEKLRFKSFAEHLKNDHYLNQMTRQEMLAVLVLEDIKSIIRQ